MSLEDLGSTEELPRAPFEDPSRRQFLGAAAASIAACTAAGALVPAVAAFLSPLEGGTVLLGGGDGKIDLGPLDSYEVGVPKKVAVRGRRTDAYQRSSGDIALGSVIVIRQGDGAVCFNSTCPHAGCDVAIKDATLGCPCHASKFALDGQVSGGPAPRPLDRLEAEVVAGHLRVVFQRFQVGTADKRAI
jgi:cytochrome b6-f complex iron-sulfur subunit/menaquinol-cytochrome c reductase iron-sulfur subunit